MKAIKKPFIFFMIVLWSAACGQNTEAIRQPAVPEPIEVEIHPPAELSVEEAQALVPFRIREPAVPFPVTRKFARILDTGSRFDAVEITYENSDEGFVMVLLTTNSKADTVPQGRKGEKLKNGAQTWEQITEHVVGVYWRHDGLTYTLVSMQYADGSMGKLYDYPKLLEIANSIQ